MGSEIQYSTTYWAKGTAHFDLKYETGAVVPPGNLIKYSCLGPTHRLPNWPGMWLQFFTAPHVIVLSDRLRNAAFKECQEAEALEIVGTRAHCMVQDETLALNWNVLFYVDDHFSR